MNVLRTLILEQLTVWLSYQNKTVKALALKSNPNAAQDSVSVWFLWSSLQSSVVLGILGIIWLQNYQE